MPAHVVLAHLIVMAAPAAALLAIGCALASRPGWLAMRWPLVVLTVAAFALMWRASDEGKALLHQVQASGTAEEYAAAHAHAEGSDALAVALFALLVVVLWSLWRLRERHPARGLRRRSTGVPTDVTPIGAEAIPTATAPAAKRHLVTRILLLASGAAVAVTTWTTVHSALAAVWIGR